MSIIGCLGLLIIGIFIKLFDEKIRQSKYLKQLIVYGFFISLIFFIVGLVQIIIK